MATYIIANDVLEKVHKQKISLNPEEENVAKNCADTVKSTLTEALKSSNDLFATLHKVNALFRMKARFVILKERFNKVS